MKKQKLTVIIIILVFTIIGAATTVSLALWRETQYGNIDIINEDELNPSARYMIYKPLGINNNILEFEEFDSSTHGIIQYDNLTSLNYMLYYKETNTFTTIQPANHEQIDAGEDLFVYNNNNVEYDSSLHGYKIYSRFTTEDYQLLYYDDDSELYVAANDAEVTQIIHNAGDVLTEGLLYILAVIQDEEDEEVYYYYYYDIVLHEGYGTISCTGMTSDGYTLYYIVDGGEPTPATPSQIDEGENIYVNEYVEYAQLEHGVFMLNTYTSNGQNIYYFTGIDYIEPTQTMLANGENLYVTNGLIISYAVVGYTGIISEVVIPSEYSPADGIKSYLITKVCSYYEAVDYSFNANSIVVSITIPSSVKIIADAVFADMVNLSYVKLEGMFEAISIGDYAFLGCYNLQEFLSNRTLLDKEGNTIDYSHNAFTGTAIS